MTTPSPYIEPPTIPEGMTVAEYRRAQLPRNEPVVLHLLRRLGRLAAAGA
jgi:hypothetical protein